MKGIANAFNVSLTPSEKDQSENHDASIAIENDKLIDTFMNISTSLNKIVEVLNRLCDIKEREEREVRNRQTQSETYHNRGPRFN